MATRLWRRRISPISSRAALAMKLARFSGIDSIQNSTRSERTMADGGKCPVTGGTRPQTNLDWRPNQLSLQVLHQHSSLSDPMGDAFDYANELKDLDLDAVLQDLHALRTDYQEW